MKRFVKGTMPLLLALVVFLAWPVNAQDEFVMIDPSGSYYYGQVQVGNSIEQFFTVTCSGVIHEIVNFRIEGSSDFPVTTPPADHLPPGESTDIGVSFVPSQTGYEVGKLHVEVVASGGGLTILEVQLSGEGVMVPLPPEEQITEILEFIRTSVDDGTLAGEGPGNSAVRRLGAFINMIKAAGELINEGDLEQACQQLQDAYERCDEDFPPPDFVAGTEREELAAKIQALRVDLGCDGM